MSSDRSAQLISDRLLLWALYTQSPSTEGESWLMSSTRQLATTIECDVWALAVLNEEALQWASEFAPCVFSRPRSSCSSCVYYLRLWCEHWKVSQEAESLPVARLRNQLHRTDMRCLLVPLLLTETLHVMLLSPEYTVCQYLSKHFYTYRWLPLLALFIIEVQEVLQPFHVTANNRDLKCDTSCTLTVLCAPFCSCWSWWVGGWSHPRFFCLRQ